MYRKVKEYFRGKPGQDGAGVKLRRCFGYYDIPKFDPFLMMDFFDSKDPDDYIKGFPLHPHRGIETITYLISGEIDHRDTLGNKGKIKDGDCQWMRAGSGILHEEMPQPSKHMLGTQIWLNIPRDKKMIEPHYRNIERDMIPLYSEEGLRVLALAGSYKDIEGPVKVEGIEPVFLDLELGPDKEFIHKAKDGKNFFAYTVSGSLNFEEGRESDSGTGVIYEGNGDILLKAGEKGARVFLLGGYPLDEEIAWGGPIVMNTKEELDLAFRELDQGNFIKHK